MRNEEGLVGIEVDETKVDRLKVASSRAPPPEGRAKPRPPALPLPWFVTRGSFRGSRLVTRGVFVRTTSNEKRTNNNLASGKLRLEPSTEHRLREAWSAQRRPQGAVGQRGAQVCVGHRLQKRAVRQPTEERRVGKRAGADESLQRSAELGVAKGSGQCRIRDGVRQGGVGRQLPREGGALDAGGELRSAQRPLERGIEELTRQDGWRASRTP